MTDPSDDGHSLPDFSAGERPRRQDENRHDEADGLHGDLNDASDQPRRPLSRGARNAIAVSAIAALLVVSLIVVLVTLFRPSDEAPDAAPPHVSEPEQRETADGEYVPDGNESEPDSEEVTTIEAPTQECEFFPQDGPLPQGGPVRTSGDISFTVPDGWGTGLDWRDSMPYAIDVDSADIRVDEGYYALAQVGQVQWSPEQGGYPGPETAATAYIQCHLTRPEGITMYGEKPLMTQYVSEATEVDGHPGWIVRGVVELQNPGTITAYTAVEMVAIVVDTPSGPAAFKVTAPADIPARASDVDAMIESLTVA